MRLFRGRRPACLALSGAVVILAGCAQGSFGPRGPAGPFHVVSASPERAVLSARGRKVAVEPMPGFCVAEDSIETSTRSAFVLIGGCVMQGNVEKEPDANGRLHLPPTMPGITTVSVSGAPGFGGGEVDGNDLSGLEDYLESPQGRELLGRGSTDSQVSVIRTQREDDALYILVEDKSAQAVPLLAPRFWRAFAVLNDRLTVVTVSGFREAPMSEDAMLRHLSGQMRELQMANANPIDDAPTRMAAAAPASAAPAAGAAPAAEAEVATGTPSATGERNFSGTDGTAMEKAREAARARHEEAAEAEAAREASPVALPDAVAHAPEPRATEDDAGVERPAPRPASAGSSDATPSRPADAENAEGADMPQPAPRSSGNGAFNAPLPPERAPR